MTDIHTWPITDHSHPLIVRAIRERNRQIQIKGYTPDHDSEHGSEQLRMAAAAYGIADVEYITACEIYPWAPDIDALMPSREAIVRATALLLAAWDTLDHEEEQERRDGGKGITSR